MNLSVLDVSPKKERQFAKRNILIAEDLLRYLPKKYDDFSSETGILGSSHISCVVVHVERFQKSFGRVETLKAFCTVPPRCERLVITWFNQNYLLDKYGVASGHEVFVAGTIKYNQQYRVYEMSTPEVFEPNISLGKRLRPVYSKIPGMSLDYLREKIELASTITELTKETLPYDIVAENGQLSMREALYKLHFPSTMSQVEAGQRRLIFDDLVYFALQQEWASRRQNTASHFKLASSDLLDDVRKSLPYELTDGQNAAVSGMVKDIASGHRINALIQGDVGCGKTIVAFLIMCAMVGSGYQAVLMAPTQVLARQHYADLSALVNPFCYEAAYLGSELKAAEKNKICKRIAAGDIKFVVGTHSVLGKNVKYCSLALTVADEEHKFGVAQRKALVEKAAAGVHSITMSATPIPRSLAQVIYGNTVQLHTIETLPKGRKYIRTGVSVAKNGLSARERTYCFLKGQIAKGHQAYVVCPMIDQNDDMDGVKSVEEVSEEFRTALEPEGIRIGTLTGKDDKAQTESTIAAFKSGEIDILISTTVIEVGVNIPNATAIVITSAERFGLASLHQLRGRVGRSSFKSYCVLESDSQTEKGRQRLEAMCALKPDGHGGMRPWDGFDIARADLAIRGAGDFIGTRQSGDNYYMQLMLAYPDEYKRAQQIASKLLDKGYQCPLVERMLSEVEDSK